MRVSFRSAIRYALLIGVLMPVFLVSCTTTVVPSGEIPRGFALWEDEQTDPGQWSALSPEGVRYRVRVVENRPPQNLAFWSRALESRMISRGFLPLGEPFSFAGGGAGGGVGRALRQPGFCVPHRPDGGPRGDPHRRGGGGGLPLYRIPGVPEGEPGNPGAPGGIIRRRRPSGLLG